MKGRRGGAHKKTATKIAGQLTAAAASEIVGPLLPGYYDDGDGLYFRVTEDGVKGWIFRFKMGGRTREARLGHYPAISRARARWRAYANRQLVADGVDPSGDGTIKWGPGPSLELPEPINIDRIVARAPGAPEDLDKAELLCHFEHAIWCYGEGIDRRHQPARRRREVLKTIKLAQQLKSRLCGDPRFNNCCAELERTIAKLEEGEHRFPKMLGMYEKNVSAFDNLIGFLLFEIFKVHFKIDKKYAKDIYDEQNPIKGLFIDVAEAVLQEFKIPYSGRQAIADALTRGSRPYRKKRGK